MVTPGNPTRDLPHRMSVIKSRHLLALSRFFTDRNDDFPILHILQLVKSLLFQGDVCVQAIISWSSLKKVPLSGEELP